MLYRKINFKYKEYILFVGFIIFFIYLHIQNNKMLYETFQSEIDAKNVKIIINDGDFSSSGKYNPSTINRDPDFYLRHYDDISVGRVEWHIKQDIMIEKIENKLYEINRLLEEIEMEKQKIGKDLNKMFENNEAGVDLPEDPDDYPKKINPDTGEEEIDVDAL